MKKGLLLAIGVSAGLSLAAQAPKVGGVKKADLTLSKTTTTDGNGTNFYASANAANANRNGNPSTAAVGTKFSSSWNAFTLLVSQSNCLTADQALNVVMFTHRISQDWSADANVSSGYGEFSWTTDCGTTWDSAYYNDYTNLGNQRFRYPSGAILNPTGNTTIAGAVGVATGPYTDGSSWQGYYSNYQMMTNSSGPGNATVYTHATQGTVPVSFPRVDMQACNDQSVWVTGGLYLNDDGTTAAAQGYRGGALMHGTWNGSAVTWTFDSIKPSFHQDGTGANDCFTQMHLAFSPNGQTGYAVFFGVEASQTNPTQRGFQPLTWKTTDGGATWNMLPAFDYSTIPAVANMLIPASDNQLHPWFSQSQGSDVVVDNNGQLHIVCTIESGSSNDNDSLGYTWTLTGQNGTTGRHYIYDTYTTANGWNSILIDSLMTTTSDNTTIFVDGSNSGAAFPTDARIQISANSTRDHIFYSWVDSDPTVLQGENALPDLYVKGIDWSGSTPMGTNKLAMTSSQDYYFHFVSNNVLTSGSTYTIPATNSIDRNGSHDVATTFDHYYSCFTVTQSQFTNAIIIGVNEQNNTFGTVSAYPNPANDLLNVNVDMKNNDNATITLFNTVGQSVLVENRQLRAGNNLVQLNTSALASGVYYLNVTSGNSSSVSKVVIE